jgi:uncharacterized membrane protein
LLKPKKHFAMSPSSIKASPVPPNTVSRRLSSVDALRGLIMIIMALDHTRDYFHYAALQFQPENLERSTAAIFLTRWITHFCAPVFMFTAGLGAWYWRSKGRSAGQLTSFLLKRGLWLVLLELTVLRIGYNFGIHGPIILTILWALGWSMVILALLSRLPVRILAPLCVVVIAAHNLTDGIQGGWLWKVLHQRSVIQAGGAVIVVAYPLIPWFAVMALGYCFGPLMTREPAVRQRWLIRIGLACTAAFVVLRAVNVYGDPLAWNPPSLLSFLNCNKYPPSLDFLLMTIGPALLVLAWFNRLSFAPGNPLIVFGRVPMFYFLAHIYLIHALTVLFALVRYGRAGFAFGSPPAFPAYPANYGYSLPVVYAVWIAVVALLYPLCRWFGKVKERRTDWWLAYL